MTPVSKILAEFVSYVFKEFPLSRCLGLVLVCGTGSERVVLLPVPWPWGGPPSPGGLTRGRSCLCSFRAGAAPSCGAAEAWGQSPAAAVGTGLASRVLEVSDGE